MVGVRKLTRKFDGTLYDFQARFRTRAAAVIAIEKWKSMGYVHVRMVKVSKGDKWVLYVRRA